MCFATTASLFRHLNVQKWSERGALYILTWKCASRHNHVHFFDISTSKSGPTMVCFGHFDFEMCFAPQRPALFWHLNFQKWSDNCVLCTFWLRNVLCATTACTFLTSQLPKVVRQWCALHILTSKCALRHNCVHFFDISTSKSSPRRVCFVHFAEGSQPSKTSRPTWVSNKDVVLKKRKRFTQTKSVDPRAQPLLQHTSKLSLHLLLCFLLTCHFLDTKRCGWMPHVDIFLSTFTKTHKNACQL